MDEKEVYYVNMICNNCDYCIPHQVSIPKGITIPAYVQATVCPKCGCKETLIRYKSYYTGVENDGGE